MNREQRQPPLPVLAVEYKSQKKLSIPSSHLLTAAANILIGLGSEGDNHAGIAQSIGLDPSQVQELSHTLIV